MSDEELSEEQPAEPSPPPAWEKDPVAPHWEDAAEDPLAAALLEEHGEVVESARTFAGDLVLQIRREAIAEVAATLKIGYGFTLLLDICGVDYSRPESRFEVVYHCYSFRENRRVRLKVAAGEDTPVPTVTGVWRGANWPEREVWDLFGVRFEGHPDLTRILLWEGFNGHPLRKDFPVEGIDTGAAIYPEHYEETAGPVAGSGTGWQVPEKEETS